LDSIQFEGIKVGLKQSKDGYVLTMAIHPDEIPDDLVRDFVGARYMVVMVRLGDDEKPMERNKKPNEPAVAMAGMLCRNPKFWAFVNEHTEDAVATEGECAEWLKYYFEIDSRADLKTNDKARDRFLKMKERFDQWNK
jgi:hypothetical protein